jgi:rhodanese-related sulfurtransferase
MSVFFSRHILEWLYVYIRIMNALQPKNSVAPRELRLLMADGGPVHLLDVRTPPEFAAVRVPGGKLIPLDDLDPAAFLRKFGAGESPVYVICQSGSRARRAIEKLANAGIHRCLLVEGGTQAWLDAGLPVDRGRSQVLPLMRQVQIVIGAVSAASAALALAVNPLFAVLPLVTGCGLLFAGTTGTCGLALLLAKMPWNRAQAGDSCCVTKGGA